VSSLSEDQSPQPLSRVRPLEGGHTPTALLLTGTLGLGHHMVTGVVADSFKRMGWKTDMVDCMSLLGPWESRLGDTIFRRLMQLPTLYDGIHFAHFRTGSWLARLTDRMATKQLVPALAEHLAGRQFDIMVATFATGASAVAQLARTYGPGSRPATLVLCTDVTPHSLWVWEGIDLFMVTTDSAAAAVRRYLPNAQIAVVPPPVRPAFYEAPSQAEARAELGIDRSDRCVLLMGGGWGLGPIEQTARLLAQRGVTVLAVAGQNDGLAKVLTTAAAQDARIRAFGYTEEIPKLMAAADLVMTTPGATTCSEARVIGRPLLLLDVIPGHGRDNVQRELELGFADVCDPDPYRLTANVLGALERNSVHYHARPPDDTFAQEFAEGLASMGIHRGSVHHRTRSLGRRQHLSGRLKEVD
jgi:processive 1,2-diacylglycerol beta-glucosyltransferase